MSRMFMAKLKKIFRGGPGSFGGFVAVATLAFILFVFLKPGNNIFHWIAASREKARQEEQIRQYHEALQRLDDRIDMLVTDRDTLEKFAREQFHLAAPGEDVYILKD